MTITLQLDQELEDMLIAQARVQGVPLDQYLQQIVSQQVRLGSPPSVANRKILKLPALHLGAMSSLRRRDFYDDEG